MPLLLFFCDRHHLYKALVLCIFLQSTDDVSVIVCVCCVILEYVSKSNVTAV